MDHLLRELAPVTAAAWAEIEKEAKRTLKATLGGRRIVDFTGPQGWTASAVGTGRVEPKGGSKEGVEARLRRVQPLFEVRVPFELPRSEIEAIDRGATDADLDPVIAAARKIALREDRAVFHGDAAAGIRGICEAEAGSALTVTDDYQTYPVVVATALGRLRDAGVSGPYAIALGERCYTGLTETTQSGYPVIEHVRRLLNGPLVWVPALDGAAVVSMRGEDFELVVGQDFSIGYRAHDAEMVALYIEETFTFRNLSPQAAIPLAYERPADRGEPDASPSRLSPPGNRRRAGS